MKSLKAGDKVLVTIDNVINDCVVVSMILQHTTYCGMLMDIAKKFSPHGIANIFDKNIETRQKPGHHNSTLNYKTPFPQPLLTRSSYHQNVPQPPLRNIFRRIRRSRRNTKLNMVPRYNETLAKLRNAKSKSDDFKCPEHISKVTPKTQVSQKDKIKGVKRKMTNDFTTNKKAKKSKQTIESPAYSDDESKVSSFVSIPEKMASPLKNLIPRKTASVETKLQRSPAIRITYKSPAGRGRVVNIPSKVHPPINNVIEKLEMQKNISKTSKCTKTLKAKEGVSFQTCNTCEVDLPKLPLLKNITDVKVKHSSDNGDSNCKNNGFMVVVKSSPKKKEHDTLLSVAKSDTTAYLMNSAKTKKNSKQGLNKPFNISNNSEELKTTSPIASVKNRHLRIVLKPLGGKKENNLLNTTDRKHMYSGNNVVPDTKISPGHDFKKVAHKHSCNPLSHTIYVTTCKDISGIQYTQGDVVWSKLSGYPWWPSRIVKLIVTKTDGEVLQQEAMVGWFQSSTTSIIPLSCIQQFEKNFNIRFEKKRKGTYQKAVNDAKVAVKEISPEVRKLISQFET